MSNSNTLFTHYSDIKIPFYDVDALQITWHGNYVKYLEVARCELLDALEYDYNKIAQQGYIFPIVDMRIKFIKPTTFLQSIIVKSMLVEYENRLKINYQLTDRLTQEKLVSAFTIQMACDFETGASQFVMPRHFIKHIENKIHGNT